MHNLRRLTVHADDVTVDVALSAALSLESLMPAITDALAATGKFGVGPDATRYALSAPGGLALDASKTLAELEIRDGTALTLTLPATAWSPSPFDDVAAAVSAAVAEQPWSPRASRLVGAFTACGLACICATLLSRTAASAGVAGTIGILTLLAAAIAYRLGDDGAGLTLGLVATAFIALAGWVAVSGGPGGENAVFAAAAAATSAALLRVIACHIIIFTTLMCCAAIIFTDAAIGVLTAAPLPAVGAGLAAVSLALIEASPSVSIALAQLSSAPVDDRLQARAIRAHTWLTSLLAALSASATLGAIGVLSEPSLPHIAFATVTGGVLLLRARSRPDMRHSAPSIVCGAVTLGAALVAAAVANPHHALHIASLSMMLSVVALYTGFMTGTLPSAARRGADLLQYFSLAAVGPLALWLCGLYGAARGLILP